MGRAVARIIIHLSAWLAPREVRARWREEWIAELSNFELRSSNFEVLLRALGAPIDAALARLRTWAAAGRAARAGARTDLHQTVRSLVRQPKHVITVVACLGIGITVSVAVFSVINSLLFGQIPGIENRQTLARVFLSHESTYGQESVGRAGMVSADALSRSDIEVIEQVRDSAFSGWAAEGDMRFAVSYHGTSAGTTGVFVSPDYFDTLGTRPARGRLLTARDHLPDAPRVAVIGYHLWRDRFGAPEDVLGGTLLVGGRPYVVVGVAPARFTGLQPTDVGASPLDYTQLWLPLRDAATWPGAPAASSAWFSVRARVASGLTIADVEPNLQAAAARIAAAYPNDRRNARFVLSPYGFGPNDSPLDVLIIIALFLAVPLSVLAIACANVANLQLARATERARELAVRIALGASRGQVVRLLSLDAAILAGLATLTGWLGAAATLSVARDMFPLSIELDRRVLIFTLILAAGVTLLSGLAPAWLVIRRSTAASVNQSARSGGLAHARLRHSLVVAQIAGSLVLLVVAGLFSQSARAMRAAAPAGLAEQLVANFDLEMLNYSPADARTFFDDVRAKAAADSRVGAVAAELMSGFRYRTVGTPADTRHYSAGGYVTASWFEVVRARLRAGRVLTADDGPGVGIVSERLSNQVAPGGSAVGQSLEVATSADGPVTIVTIVGVIADIRRRPEIELPDAALYLPLPATPPSGVTLRLSTAQPDAVAAKLRQIVRAIDDRVPLNAMQTAEELYLRELGPIRYVAVSVGAGGLVAMLLAATGLFAVMAYVVSLRTHEIGVRVAVGASRRDVIRLVLRQSLKLATAGTLAGMVLALPLSFALRAMFIGVSPIDPVAIAPAVTLLFLTALIAGAVPARRAASIDPVKALRQD